MIYKSCTDVGVLHIKLVQSRRDCLPREKNCRKCNVTGEHDFKDFIISNFSVGKKWETLHLYCMGMLASQAMTGTLKFLADVRHKKNYTSWFLLLIMTVKFC